MGTTVSLDDDLAEAGSGTAGLEPFVVEPQSCGWMPGIDPLRLNQLVDGLELEAWPAQQPHGGKPA